MRLFIAEAQDFDRSVLEKLQRYFDVVDVRRCTQREVKEILELNDVFWFRLGFRIGRDMLSKNTRCRYIVSPVTGIDHIDEGACADFGIRIISLRGETEFLAKVRATAEHTILLALLLMRPAIRAVESVRKGVWDRDLFRGHEIFQKKVGIIGTGRLGSIAGSYFRALGATVAGFDHRDDFPYHIFERKETLEDLAAYSDIVSVHLSYTRLTHHLVNHTFFTAMKPGSFFINTSRGGIVDERALLKALRSGKLAGAAVDVVQDEYGNLANNELIKYGKEGSNLLITPHIGGNTYESFEMTENFVAEKLIAAVVGYNLR